MLYLTLEVSFILNSIFKTRIQLIRHILRLYQHELKLTNVTINYVFAFACFVEGLFGYNAAVDQKRK